MNHTDFDKFNSVDGASSRSRRYIPETGSFGKSTRRSRSRTYTPGVKKQEDPTLAAADKIFGAFIAKKAAAQADSPQRKNKLTSSVSQTVLSGNTSLNTQEGNVDTSRRYVHKEPTEVILHGFKSTQQYAAIREYEHIAGRICEDYPRDPPIELRKYKTDLRDPASLRKKPMTAGEKMKALRFAGGEHWIKITYESAEAAEIAVESSPQIIMGHIVSAELYRGVPPTNDEEVLANTERTPRAEDFFMSSSGRDSRSVNAPKYRRTADSLSMTGSLNSSQTIDTTTLSTATAASSSTVRVQSQPAQPQDESNLLYCRRIPTAKRIQLLPAEQALLPQPSYIQRLLANIPLIGWLSSDIIGSQVPKTENGEFDWVKASLYWKLIWWVDGLTGWFDVMADDKEE